MDGAEGDGVELILNEALDSVQGLKSFLEVTRQTIGQII